ncbi:hypothetical protein J6590_017656 [Homalodisca vitripennis]|nr:hypothetical protein J6590_017656 [Homalodisca vitripennis]
MPQGGHESLLLTDYAVGTRACYWPDYAAGWAREPVTGLTRPQSGHESLLLDLREPV